MPSRRDLIKAQLPAFLIPSAYAQANPPSAPAATNVSINADALRALLAGPSGTSLLGHVALGTGAVRRTAQQKLAERVSVEDFGAAGDGVADDTRAFNSALATAAAKGWGQVGTRPNTDYRTTGLVTVPTGTTLVMADGSALVYHGNGTAVRVEPAEADDDRERYARAQAQRRNVIRVIKANIAWHNAARNQDSASIGIQMVNQRYSEHELYATGFFVGVELIGMDEGYPAGGAHQGNTYSIYARNNRTQVLETRSGSTGYVNQNTWIGGLMRNDSPYRASGTRGFDGSGGANGWTFVGVNCEGNSMEQVFRFGGPRNTVLNCRFESAEPGMVKVLAKGGVTIIGCYIGRAGPALVDVDPGGGWVMQSEIGSWSQNSLASYSCYTARLTGVSGYGYRFLNSAGVTLAEWEGGQSLNRLDVYTHIGKQDARTNPAGLPQPALRFDFAGRALRLRAAERAGDGDADAATLSWSSPRYLTLNNIGLQLETVGFNQEIRLKNTRLWVDAQGRIRVLRAQPTADGDGNVLQESEAGATSRRPPSPAAGQMFFDVGLGRPVWWSGSRWVDASGAAA